MARALPFTPRTNDIYLATYPRSGTTLVQMILWQLINDRDPEFDHISDVMPFLEESLRHNQPLHDLASPRILKTHLPCRQVRAWPGKYLYVVRDGRDVLISYFHFYRSYVNSSRSFDDFFANFLAGRVLYGSWFQHVAAWQGYRNDPSVLFLRYEDLIENVEASIRKIALFLEWPFNDGLLQRAKGRSTMAYMRRYEAKFVPKRVGLKTGSDSGTFIRQGISGCWREQLSSTQVAEFERMLLDHNLMWAVVPNALDL